MLAKHIQYNTVHYNTDFSAIDARRTAYLQLMMAHVAQTTASLPGSFGAVSTPPQNSQSQPSHSSIPPPQVIKTSKEWILPPRPKPGRKLKDQSNQPAHADSLSLSPPGSCSSSQAQKKKKKKKPTAPTSHSDCCTAASNCHRNSSNSLLSSDISTISSLLKNIAIIDGENMSLKSNLLCLIHEYKHLKNSVLNPITTTIATTSSTSSTASQTTTPVATTGLTTSTSSNSNSNTTTTINASTAASTLESGEVQAVHKRSFNEVQMMSSAAAAVHKVELDLDESQIDEEHELTHLLSPLNKAISLDSSVISTTVSTPCLQPTIAEFDEFIKIDEMEDEGVMLKKCKTNDSTPLVTRRQFNYEGEVEEEEEEEEDSDLDINFEEEEEEEEEVGGKDLSRTTSPYSSDYDSHSLMSSLTRSTTVSSIGTTQDKPAFNLNANANVNANANPYPSCYSSSSASSTPLAYSAHKHAPPFTLKKMGTYFDLPKYEESNGSSPYRFKFDASFSEDKKHDDAYNYVADFLEEKLVMNHLSYYSIECDDEAGDARCGLELA
ncbi:uncharacterized protein LODBEIA_P40010 [Lodderomyces beijingensis]|uniref:Hap4 transcription factor heteromerisation domain-containing protein n=1 Tax=Lodderomyces beijingensis TaxID=1775926 RepID=A0ABP0ZNS9_9ASCO